MSKSKPAYLNDSSGTKVKKTVHHSREDVVSDSRYDKLLAAADRLSYPFDVECRFVLIGCGRLGLRAGELCHVTEDWIDWDSEMLRIPTYSDCSKGRDGGPCGYCRTRAESAVEHTEGLTMEAALDRRWNPKTDAGARAVPFGFSERVKDTLAEFFFCFDGYEHSRASVNRRVDRVLEEAGLPQDSCYPHALRATAATYHSVSGLSTAALQSLMGWSSLTTAQKYVRASGGQTQRALEEAHSD